MMSRLSVLRFSASTLRSFDASALRRLSVERASNVNIFREQVLLAANGSLRYRIHNLSIPQYHTKSKKKYFVSFNLMRFLRSGQKTKKRASAPGCKWLELHRRIQQLVVLRYHTNPNLFLKFFYLLRFLRNG